MPYREASLSFEGIHIACLCGDNGNGKSALLDAITWALWGKARSRSDDELIHLRIALEFQGRFSEKGLSGEAKLPLDGWVTVYVALVEVETHDHVAGVFDQ
jgi:recombinational DNA repair ATPase RecF